MVFVYVCCCCDCFSFFFSNDGRGIHAYDLATIMEKKVVLNRGWLIVVVTFKDWITVGVKTCERCRNFSRDTFSITISRFREPLCCVKWIHNIYKNTFSSSLLLIIKNKRWKKKSEASAYLKSRSHAEEYRNSDYSLIKRAVASCVNSVTASRVTVESPKVSWIFQNDEHKMCLFLAQETTRVRHVMKRCYHQTKHFFWGLCPLHWNDSPIDFEIISLAHEHSLASHLNASLSISILDEI